MNATIPLTVDRDDPAQQLRFSQKLLIAVNVARIAAPLVADLQELACLARRLDHLACPGHRTGHLLLAVDVQTCVETTERMPRVPEVRRRDNHCVEVLLAGEHIFIINVCPGRMAVVLKNPFGTLETVRLPDVTDRLEPYTADMQTGIHQGIPLRSGAQKSHVDVVWLALTGRLGHESWHQRETCTRRGRRPQKPTSIQSSIFVRRSHMHLPSP